MKITMLYGRWSTAIHGDFDLNGLFATKGLTGSESSFWNTARSLVERGHKVNMSCPATASTPMSVWGIDVHPLSKDKVYRPHMPADTQVCVAWNEPHLLSAAPPGAIRVLCHQINDFNIFPSGWENFVDHFVLVSESQRRHLHVSSKGKMSLEKSHVIPNSIEPELYDKTANALRKKGSIVFTSSPDRGLHRMLDIYLDVRKRVPYATLDVFYEWEKIYQAAKEKSSISGIRCKYIASILDREGFAGERGITMRGFVSNVAMAQVLEQTDIFAYPCEPLRYTEGFSVSTLDACYAGCIPIISDADALGEIYAGAATIIKGPPVENKEAWVDAIVGAIADDDINEEAEEAEEARRMRAMKFAEKFERQKVALQWEELLSTITASARK